VPPLNPGLLRRASIDLSIVVANAVALAGSRDPTECVVDVRADAYGHGLQTVGAALLDAGFGALMVSPSSAPSDFAGRVVLDPDDAQRLLGPGIFAGGGELRPAMRLSTEAVAVKAVPAGTGVSYGYTYRTPRATRLVLCALGFADGVPRLASNRAPVLAGSTRGRVTGRVAMDQFVVDIGEAPAAVGDEVVLFGDPLRGEPTAAEWSEATGVPATAILAGLRGRIERVYAS
jgi:alanine racemase